MVSYQFDYLTIQVLKHAVSKNPAAPPDKEMIRKVRNACIVTHP